jgi:hypothetical protein
MTTASRVLIGAPVALVLSIAAFHATAQSSASTRQEQLAAARGLVCDTAEEVEAFVGANPDEKVDAALARVNDHFGKNACSILTSVFRKCEQANTMMIPDGVVRITRIEIVGVEDGAALVRLKEPRVQYTPFFEKAESI